MNDPMRHLFLVLVLFGSSVFAQAGEMPWIEVAKDKKGFVLTPSGHPFVPWGFNYDHDANGRLLEDYWETEWPAVEAHFDEMKTLGANVIRVHLQLGKFMERPETANDKSLDRLAKLVALAERLHLYLDLTGLGCYHKKDVPTWYDKLQETDRWDVQARFWRAIAGRVGKSPVIFCYDLMNEPVVPGGRRTDGDWLGPPFAGNHFVQLITLDQQDRPRYEIARQWIQHLSAAIRQTDRRHLITVGLVDWSLDRPGLTSGFIPSKIIADLDFVSVHLYPATGKVHEELETLKGFAVGKPVVIEETFPLNCSANELGEFIDQSTSVASGWIGFYWGKTPTEYRQSAAIEDVLVLSWLELFHRHGPPAVRPEFIIGADVSWVQQQGEQGIRFSDHGVQKDIFSILKDHGFNWIRLRVFYDPRVEHGYSNKGYCDLDHTLLMAKRIKAAGMGFLLDFHYSDTWADPGHQIKPAGWVNLHGADLEKALHDYTKDVLTALKKQGAAPDMVQIGNEISNGFLWPDGEVWKSGKWDVFCGLIKAGIAGTREVDPSTKIMLHLALGGQNGQSRAFLDKALAQGVEFDVVGQSYYPRWHGTLADLKSNLTDLAGRYKQSIIVVEYSVPNVRQINDTVRNLPDGKGLGAFIWEPTSSRRPALFDNKGNAKPEIDDYQKMSEDYHQK